MSRQNVECVYQAVVVPDEQPGIPIRRLYIEPCIKDQAEAHDIEKAVGHGTKLITLEDDLQRAKFMIRAGQLVEPEEIIAKVNEAVQPHGHSVVPLEGLPLQPTAKDYAGFIAHRQWERAA